MEERPEQVDLVDAEDTQGIAQIVINVNNRDKELLSTAARLECRSRTSLVKSAALDYARLVSLAGRPLTTSPQYKSLVEVALRQFLEAYGALKLAMEHFSKEMESPVALHDQLREKMYAVESVASKILE